MRQLGTTLYGCPICERLTVQTRLAVLTKGIVWIHQRCKVCDTLTVRLPIVALGES